MNGKIKVRLKQKASMFNNRYEVFVDENFVGSIDYKQPKIDFLAGFGHHKIEIKGKDFNQAENFIISSNKLVVPIDINENPFYSKANSQLPKSLKGIVLGISIFYSLLLTYLLFFKQIRFGLPLLFPFAILLFINSIGKESPKFHINIG